MSNGKRMKYIWLPEEFDRWLTQQSSDLNQIGIKAGREGGCQLLLDRVIKPNNIQLRDIVKPQVRVRWKRKQTF